MVSEDEVKAILPPDGWLTQYVYHGMRNSTAPNCYHVATGLVLLSMSCPSEYGMAYAGILRANLYSMLVGRSGDDQKSTALGIAKNILHKANPALRGDQPGSPEGLLEGLQKQPQQVISYPEFGKFLAAAQKGYFEPIKAVLTDVWDCEPQQRRKVKDQLVSVENPRLSMMVGCSLTYLEKHTDPADWTGGFLGRWLIMYGRRDRIVADPVPDNTATDWLVDELKRRMEIKEVGVCTGLSPAAKQLWEEWFFELDGRKIPEIIAGAKTRVPAMARKAALLYAWDFGLPCSGETWEMDEITLSYGIAVAELHLKSLVGLSEMIAEHDDARERRSFLECVPPGGSVRFSEILYKLKIKRRKASDILEGLLLDGSLRRQLIAGVSGDCILSRPLRYEEAE